MLHLNICSNALFICFTHFKNKKSCCPLHIPRKRKCAANFMNGVIMKNSKVFRRDYALILFFVTWFKRAFHTQLNRHARQWCYIKTGKFLS
jgi:hypothetical protein